MKGITTTAGRTKRNVGGNYITMISVTPNYTGDESGLWATEQHQGPRLAAVQITTGDNTQ